MNLPSRLFDFIHYQAKHYPQGKALNYKQNGQWKSISTSKAIELINKVSCGLLELGVRPGDKIATVVYKNRPEWTIVDAGMNQIGAINVPLYATISPEEYAYILNDAGVKMAFVGEADLYDKVAEAKGKVTSLGDIYTFDQQEGRLYWEEMFSESGQSEVEKIKSGIDAESLATIIYTSGTTGQPKGVMLSHRNIVSNTIAIRDYFPCEVGDRVLSFLPVCHIFERTANYTYISQGYNIYYTGMDNLGGESGDIREVKPHFFTAVPRLLEKVYEKIYAKGKTLTGIKKKLFFWALDLTEDWEYGKKYNGLNAWRWRIADKLIFSKWREALGGSVKGIVCGSAPLAPRLAQVFSAAGIPIREGYGLTETSPGLCIAQFRGKGAKLGYIGPAIPGVEIMIDDSDGGYVENEGEVLARGPNIMMGYYQKPAETAAVFKEIGGETWFKTGDIGRYDDVGLGAPLLKITDRKKELLKTSGGKYVAPAPIESKLKESFLVEQAMIIGDKRKFVSALIVPAMENLASWSKEVGISFQDMKDLFENESVKNKYDQIIASINPQFSHVEQIKKYVLLPNEWLPRHADGSKAELTPTLKLKRRVILEKFAHLIDRLYGDD
jgi:long-chain acyl-CoA synthetase